MAASATTLGTFVLGYGLLLLPVSPLGGAWVAAGGLSLLLAGLFSTAWVQTRLGFSAATGRSLSLGFGVLAVVLLVSFVVLSYASFTPVQEAGGEASG